MAQKRGRRRAARGRAEGGLAAALALAAAAAGAQDPAYLAVDRGVCARMVEHVPDADVTFRPGVDVHGRPVAPADLAPPLVAPPPVIWIPLDVDLRRRFGIPPDRRFFEGKAYIGTVRVEGDRVTYDGQDLTDPQAQALAEACRRAVGGP